jgi:uncharacterized membrane protein HdeD (DUF308 family)/pimeloyl-ACP methyl ester carboxylesterase
MKLVSFFTRQTDRLRGLPWVARLVLGLVPIALGLIILLRPFDSLTLLIVLIALCLAIDGVARLVSSGRAAIPALQVVAGVVEVVAAIVSVAWPLISVLALAIVVGGSLIVNGVADLIDVFRRGQRSRAASLLLGLALLIFGVLSLLWQDVSLIVIAFAFALQMTVFGIGVVARAIRNRGGLAERHDVRSSRTSSRLVLVASVAGRALLLAFALVALGGSILLHQGVPTPSAFYTPPATVPSAPGQLLRSEPYTQSVPAGARGWLILYTTTDLNDRPTVGSSFVMAPDAASASPRQVVLWDHGTQGADVTCAPTLLPKPLPLAAPLAAMKDELKAGRVLVGPDFPGMGTPGPQGYLVGQDEGRSALDAVRAAHQLEGLSLSAQTVIWGHSQGGQAALWTGILAPSYAPDLDIVGVAAAAPAANTPGLVEQLENSVLSKVFGPDIIRAYSETYPDVKVTQYIDPRLIAMYEAASTRCLPEASTQVSVLTALTIQGPMFSADPTTGPLGARLRENIPTGPIKAPVFIAQGTADPLVLPAAQDAYVRDRCAAGQPLEYKKYKGKDHLSVVADDSPYTKDLESWTDDRFAGKPAETTCN